MNKEWVSKAELARILQVHRSAVGRYVEKGQIPKNCTKLVGKKLLIDSDCAFVALQQNLTYGAKTLQVIDDLPESDVVADAVCLSDAQCEKIRASIYDAIARVDVFGMLHGESVRERVSELVHELESSLNLEFDHKNQETLTLADVRALFADADYDALLCFNGISQEEYDEFYSDF